MVLENTILESLHSKTYLKQPGLKENLHLLDYFFDPEHAW
jgi:hypothetical protein